MKEGRWCPSTDLNGFGVGGLGFKAEDLGLGV